MMKMSGVIHSLEQRVRRHHAAKFWIQWMGTCRHINIEITHNDEVSELGNVNRFQILTKVIQNGGGRTWWTVEDKQILVGTVLC